MSLDVTSILRVKCGSHIDLENTPWTKVKDTDSQSLSIEFFLHNNFKSILMLVLIGELSTIFLKDSKTMF